MGRTRDLIRIVNLQRWGSAVLAGTLLGPLLMVVPWGRAAAPLSFNQDIRPILSENCFLCHGPDEEGRKADLRLDESGSAFADRDGIQAIVPSNPEESELIRRILTDDLDARMPPEDSERILTNEEKELLKAWIAAGAKYERHWAFEPIVKPVVPDVPDDTLCANPIDRFILARLRELDLDFSLEVSREKLIRRVSFDLTGLPPTVDEIDGFLNDLEFGSYERLVDRLLQRESYGERLASEWLDVARYSDTYGYQVDRDRFVWPWRDWVIEAFNANLPYDEFMTWQIAGDLLPGANERQILATTFNRLHPQKVEGGSVPEEFRVEYVADRTQTFATAFMGLTLECARCHDHKYDPLKQKEYYQLTSFFANIDEAGLYSYFTDSIPTPTLVLGPKESQEQLRILREETLPERIEAVANTVKEAGKAFESWLTDGRGTEEAIKSSVAYFDFESIEDGKIPNLWEAGKPATTAAANQQVAGKEGFGLALTGDDEVDLKVGNFPRHQPFSFSLWVKLPESYDRSVIFHRSRAWTDAASRGYQYLIKEGNPSFSLIHFWPGNAIRVRGRNPLPVGRFVHLGVTYDGSSRAEGIRLFVDGEAIELTMVRDCLTKNITGGGHDHVAIGARFRDKGFKGGVVDEFRIFDRELAPVEMRHLFDGETLSILREKSVEALSEKEKDLLRAYFFLAIDPQVAAVRDELKAVRSQMAQIEDGLQEIMVMKERSHARTSYLLSRGAYDARSEPVVNETPAVLPGFPEDQSRNRLGLAKWLALPSHPLTARVAVNRYWQMIFGQGLVRTPEDFGSQGSPPSHPELLDWLAADFIENGWNVKRLLRQMVVSMTYRQSSTVSAELMRRDPENLWLAWAPRYRLPAEMIRDNALAVSGLLVDKIGGPPVKPYEVAVSFKPTKVDEGEGLYRRSLYTYWKRTGPAPVMMALDASKRDVCSVRRETTTTPLQSFVFMNDPQFVEAARHLALAVMDSSAKDDAERLDHVFRQLTSRHAKPAELAVLGKLFQEQKDYFAADVERVKAFLSVGSSALSEEKQTVDLAALAVVASGVMSHDECIMKW
ncbi:MAG: hypothetical protein M2R45_02270 [Verrucomicrobia subdivision 3 bacterium]|nr:hypothetical protein [Limisphaerales bacterium]MCS1413944.1 hypothetical protein [Limisphaerales bacterium]